MVNVTDHRSLIETLGGGAKVAEAIGEQGVTVRAMAARNRIPAEHWPAFIELSKDEGCPVSADWLMRTTPPRRRAKVAA